MAQDDLSGRPALYIGTFMRVLSEQMQSQSVRLVEEVGLPIRPSNVMLMSKLFHSGRHSVGELSLFLGLAQPTVTRALRPLIDAGLIKSSGDATDQRLTFLELTEAGRAVWIEAAVKVFGPLEAAVEKLLEQLSGSLLEMLGGLRAELRAESMAERASKLRGAGLRVIEFSDEVSHYFTSITVQWMHAIDQLQSSDLEVLSRPQDMIIDKGGEILFVESKGAGIVGTGSLVRKADGRYYLAHFGVVPAARGGGVGTLLGSALIERARMKGAESLSLVTRRELRPAIQLYEQLGFKHYQSELIRIQNEDNRAEIFMMKDLIN